MKSKNGNYHTRIPYAGQLDEDGKPAEGEFRGRIHWVTYTFREGYVENFVKENESYFIERHNFAHYATPAKHDTKLIFTLGKQNADDQFEFLTVQVPYDSVLALKPNTIHSDALSKGEIAIALTADFDAEDVDAIDTVYLRRVEDKVARRVAKGVVGALSPRSRHALGTRRRLMNRPKSHIVVLETLLEKIKRLN